MPDPAPIPLSVVVATTRPWPEVRRCLDSLHGQARAMGAEIILADGHGHGMDDESADLYPYVTWLKAPGASVFSLRALAMSQARGQIVAVTEDHCEVTPGWCELVVKAHKDRPDAAAIGGAVENGATQCLIDWANFLLVFGPFTLPIDSGEKERISLQANVSYKRRVIPRAVAERGMMEMLFNQQLRQRGEKLVADNRLVVYHIQSHGFFATFRTHFHNGRSIAGFRLQHTTRLERLLRLGGCLILPPVLLWRTIWPVWVRRRLRSHMLASLPFLALLVCCHTAGEFIGYILGAGKSPRHIP